MCMTPSRRPQNRARFRGRAAHPALDGVRGAAGPPARRQTHRLAFDDRTESHTMRRCWAYAIVFYVSSTVGAAAAAAAYGVRQSCSTCLDSAATATATATTTTAGFPSTRLPPSQPVSTALAQGTEPLHFNHIVTVAVD